MNSTNLDGPALIAAERYRQIQVEGYSTEHDDGHVDAEMSRAAACYAEFAALITVGGTYEVGAIPDDWPWGKEWWKPSGDPVRNLVKAGALIAAEIDRLNRREYPSGDSGNEDLSSEVLVAFNEALIALREFSKRASQRDDAVNASNLMQHGTPREFPKVTQNTLPVEGDKKDLGLTRGVITTLPTRQMES